MGIRDRAFKGRVRELVKLGCMFIAAIGATARAGGPYDQSIKPSARKRGKSKRHWRWAVTLPLPLVCALPSTSGATTVDGITFPTTERVDGRVLHLNGVGVRTATIFRIHVYLAALYVEHPSHDANAIEASPEIKTLFLEFMRSASKERVQNSMRKSEAAYCKEARCPASDAQDIEQFVAKFPAVKHGDYITYVFSPGGLRVLLNNTPLVAFSNPDFARRFLDSFIGLHATIPSLRNALLGH